MIKRSYIWAGVFAAAMAGWLGSGELLPNLKAEDPPKPKKQVVEDKLFRVEVERFVAQQRREVLTLKGRTESYKTLEVLVRTRGIVEGSPRKEGELVVAGDVLCKLDISDRKARLAQSKAELASAKRDFEAAQKLAKRKFASEAKLATERARLDAALAVVEQRELDVGWTTVRAPIGGTIAERPAEQGKYLKIGDTCAVLKVLDPIRAIAQVSERQVSAVRVGAPAVIKLVNGQRLEGTVRFIAPQADIDTRTFRMEVEAPNPDRRVRSGITAKVELELPPIPAHLLPSSLISLNDNGVIGVHSVQPDNTVKFVPIKLLSLSRGGTWVGGLPNEITLITIGQHYVLDGQVVEPVFREDGSEDAQS